MACKNNDDDNDIEPPGVDAGYGTLSMKVDGADWSSKDDVDGAVIGESQGSLVITSTGEDGSQFNIQLLTPDEGDTWNFDNGGSMSFQPDGPTAANTFIYTPGQGFTSTITFTTYNDNRAEGTFAGTLLKFTANGTEEVVITDGKFDLNF